MKIGFTGTREGMTDAQKKSFIYLIETLRPESFSHGECVGADEQAHELLPRRNPPIAVEIHPPSNPVLRARCFGRLNTTWHPPKPYLERNRDIVDSTDVLIVCPKEESWMMGVRRGGTWSTHVYALKQQKSHYILWPDGLIHHHDQVSPTKSVSKSFYP